MVHYGPVIISLERLVIDLVEMSNRRPLTRAAIVVILNVNINRILEVTAELLRLLLCKGIPGNDCT
jgi:hypothetical protein